MNRKEDKQDKIEFLTDELMNTASAEDRNASDTTSDSTLLYKKLRKVIMRMDVSSNLADMADEMRESILLEIHQRIDKTVRRTLWMKAIAVAASIAILLGLTNYLSYRQGYKQLNGQTIEMTNPLGIQSVIVLSDGTKVHLNAGTTLKYPSQFIHKNREVEISGEAFFEVTPDRSHPFIVNAENLKVRVWGTCFNVKAYQEEESIEVTLENGRVEVGLSNQKRFHPMTPGQQIFFNKQQHTFKKTTVNLDCYISWKEGKFYFNGATFEDIARQLERRFNVRIHIASEPLKQTVFTGDFVRNENLEQMLRVMTADKRIRYTMDGDQIHIYTNLKPITPMKHVK
jgi:ferric-dicitrate binding protein FerR (iron transport regulator)